VVDDQLDEEAQEIAQDMNKILKRWHEEIGAPPGAVVQFDAFMMDCKLHAVTAFLIEKGVIEDERELNNFIGRWMVNQMNAMFPQAKEAKLQALQMKLAPGPRFDIPRGNNKH
jgi:hypothetical protein